MERRFYLGVALLAVILVAGLFTGWAMEKRQQPVVRLLEQAAQEEDLQSGAQLARQAKATWKKRWKAVAAVADHTPMDEIDKLFAELDIYIRENEDVHFYACCSQLASLLRAVSEAHALNWWNVM